jgi:23S rRNA-/tRNA-specific pseudouridylate synthase
VHQIRSHLAYGINCPLLGEAKYNTKEKDVPINLNPRILEALEMKPDAKRKIPMLIHLAEVLIPIGSGSKFSVIKAPYPMLFVNTLRYLSLFKK